MTTSKQKKFHRENFPTLSYKTFRHKEMMEKRRVKKESKAERRERIRARLKKHQDKKDDQSWEKIENYIMDDDISTPQHVSTGWNRWFHNKM